MNLNSRLVNRSEFKISHSKVFSSGYTSTQDLQYTGYTVHMIYTAQDIKYRGYTVHSIYSTQDIHYKGYTEHRLYIHRIYNTQS